MTTAARPQRADAARNRAAILDAALSCLARDPQASMAAIAAEAGVGRVTLYGHFASRAELIESLLVHVLHGSEQALALVDTDGSASEALRRLVDSSWKLLNTFRMALAAAENELPAETIRRHHEAPLRRVESVIERGRAAGEFRHDLPAAWQVACFYTILHTAAGEISAGRLAEVDASDVIWTTLASVLTA